MSAPISTTATERCSRTRSSTELGDICSRSHSTTHKESPDMFIGHVPFDDTDCIDDCPGIVINGGFVLDNLIATPAPVVTAHKVINCDTHTEIATIPNGGFLSVDPNAVGNPSCLGIGVLVAANADTGDGSVGHDYTPAPGEGVTNPYEGEINPPFAYPNEAGWTIPGEIAACHCGGPSGKGDLTHSGSSCARFDTVHSERRALDLG